MTCDYDQGWDEGATLLGLQLANEDTEESTLVHASPVKPIPAPHRTPEEAEDTACVELAPLRLDQLGALAARPRGRCFQISA